MDAIGKVFQVEGSDRRCKVCEQLFSRAEAANHATAICLPVETEISLPLLRLHGRPQQELVR